MKKTLQEYYVDDTALHEWLPYGGLVHSSMLMNKDDSVMGFFRYSDYYNLPIVMLDGGKPIHFVNGWSFWTEQRHYNQKVENVFIVVWNPFIDREKYAVNTLNGIKIKREEINKYFHTVLMSIEQSLKEKMKIELLRNEQILSLLASAISMEPEEQAMPETALYFDALLSDKVKFEALSNQIKINDKSMVILTLPSLGQFEPFKISDLLNFIRLGGYEYRFCRRLLIFQKDAAQKEMNRHTRGWCNNRSVMKNLIQQDLLKEINGYCSNVFIFFGNENELKENLRNIKYLFETVGLPYIIENENYKEAWWASLPGFFRANVTLPIQGINGFRQFLLSSREEQ